MVVFSPSCQGLLDLLPCSTLEVVGGFRGPRPEGRLWVSMVECQLCVRLKSLVHCVCALVVQLSQHVPAGGIQSEQTGQGSLSIHLIIHMWHQLWRGKGGHLQGLRACCNSKSCLHGDVLLP